MPKKCSRCGKWKANEKFGERGSRTKICDGCWSNREHFTVGRSADDYPASHTANHPVIPDSSPADPDTGPDTYTW